MPLRWWFVRWDGLTVAPTEASTGTSTGIKKAEVKVRLTCEFYDAIEQNFPRVIFID